MQADRSVTAKLRAFIDFTAPLLRGELARSANLIGLEQVNHLANP